MFFLGRKSVTEQEMTTTIKIDTVFVEKPIPYEIEKVRKEYVYVPTPADTVVREVADTVVREVEVVRVDSVLIAVDIERREYRDSSYRAVISGAVVGNIHPSLDSIEVYNRTIVMQPPTLRPYVSASIGNDMIGVGAGLSIKNKHDIGTQVWRISGKTKLTIDYKFRF